MKSNFKIPQILLLWLTTTLVACSGSSSGNSGGVTPNITTSITIDNAGVVPIIGNTPTTSVVYVHNNDTVAINGISYTAISNIESSSRFLDTDSAAACSSIPAGQSCPLSFTTPQISSATAQGSTLITASYSTSDGKVNSFSQTISYAIVANAMTNGAVFNSGVLLTSSGNPTAYGTLYLYGSGANQLYTVNSLALNKGGVQIIQGNISGKQMQSNYVQAVEISATSPVANTSLALSAGFSANLTATSSLADGTQFTSVANIGVTPAASGAILTSGQVPIINTAALNTTSSIYITNAGNTTATLGEITFPSGVTSLSESDSCGASLAAGAGCTIYFRLPRINGNGNISIPYNGGSASPLVQTITWYNSVSQAILAVRATSNPLSFSATIGGSTRATIINSSGYNLTSISASAPTASGSATSQVGLISCTDESGNATESNLPINGSCSYTLTVNDNASEQGNINLNISLNYNNGVMQTYSQMLSLPYISNQYSAILSVTPNAMTIVGDNQQTASQTLTINNNGEAPAVISASSLTSNPAYLTIESQTNACSNQTLTAGESCTVVLKLGPITQQAQESGIAVYTVSYSGGQAPNGTTSTGNIPWSVQADSQNLTMTSIATSNTITGNGASATTAYSIPGTTSNPTITFTYSNGGTNPVTISGISNSNSPISWNIDTIHSTCYHNGALPSASIAVNASCTIVFNNVLAEYALAASGGLGASYSENITVPTLILQDQVATAIQFSITPPAPAPINGNTVYVTGNQAVLTNSVLESGNTVIVSHTLTNASSYGPLNVTSEMENYFTGTPVTSNCTATDSSGVEGQICTLTPDSSGTANASVTYTVDTTLYPSGSIDVLFSLIPSSQIVSFTPLSATITFP